jgi:hypothetical protein
MFALLIEKDGENEGMRARGKGACKRKTERKREKAGITKTYILLIS